MPKISVIVPVYKVEKYLHRCVDSILNQSFTDFELILVNDGSPDNCPKICDEYEKKDNRIVVIHKENGGLSDARNKGIDYAFENSNSEWLTFIDSDDWIHKDYLKFLYKACIENNVDISICNFERTECEKITDKNLTQNFELWSSEDFYFKKHYNFTVAWGTFYKKYLFENIRYPYGKLHEDEFTSYKLIFKIKKLAYISNDLYYYFNNENSIMNNFSDKNFIDAMDALRLQVNYITNNIKRNNIKKIMSLYYIYFLYDLVTNHKFNNKLTLLIAERNKEELSDIFKYYKVYELLNIYYFSKTSPINIGRNIKIFLTHTIRKYIFLILLKYKKFFLLSFLKFI